VVRETNDRIKPNPITLNRRKEAPPQRSEILDLSYERGG
jgi:hypothetical protein